MERIFFHSPFSPHTVTVDPHAPRLLLQFLIKEILCFEKPEPSPGLTPLGWFTARSSLERIKEHLDLLEYALPDFSPLLRSLFPKKSATPEKELLKLLPLIEQYKGDLYLRDFLHRHHHYTTIQIIEKKLCLL